MKKDMLFESFESAVIDNNLNKITGGIFKIKLTTDTGIFYDVWNDDGSYSHREGGPNGDGTPGPNGEK